MVYKCCYHSKLGFEICRPKIVHFSSNFLAALNNINGLCVSACFLIAKTVGTRSMINTLT
jgi:hypothetical protein